MPTFASRKFRHGNSVIKIHLKKSTAMNDEEIRQGLTEAFHQLEEVKAGKRKTRNAEELLYEL